MKTILNMENFKFNDTNDSYYELVNERFNDMTKDNKRPIFRVKYDDLYDKVFIANLPEELRQYYNCNTCKKFFSNYSKYVFIDETDGHLESLLFGSKPDKIPEIFRKADAALKDAVEHAKISSYVVFDKKELGNDGAGGFHHFHLNIPTTRMYTRYYNKSYQINTMNERMDIAIRNHIEYTEEDVNNALRLMESKEIIQSNKFKPILEQFKELKKLYLDNFYTQNGRNLFRLKTVTLPESVIYIKNSVVGKLLDDVKKGLPHYVISENFNKLVDPVNYMRSQEKPSEGNVKEAEKIVSQLGLESALQRRYATLDEIKTIWTPTKIEEKKKKNSTNGIFSDIETKESSYESKYDNGEINVGTIETSVLEFVSDVLSKVKEMFVDFGEMERKRPFHTRRYPFMGITTQEDPNAKPIMIWDREDERNPFSTYIYQKGSTKESWNITDKVVEVTAVTNNPSCWFSDKYSNYENCIFILKDCKDLNEEPGMCLFPEVLIRELYPVRSTISAFSNTHNLSGKEIASACGLATPSASTDRRKYSDPIELIVKTELGKFRYRLVSWK